MRGRPLAHVRMTPWAAAKIKPDEYSLLVHETKARDERVSIGGKSAHGPFTARVAGSQELHEGPTPFLAAMRALRLDVAA